MPALLEMRALLLFASATLAALLLQSTLWHWLPLGGAIPDVLLILCVYLGLHQHSVAGVIGAFVLGYVQDSFSGSIPGANAFAMTLVYAVVYLTSRRLWVDNVLSTVVLVFLASVFKTLTVGLLLATFVATEGLTATLAHHLVLDSTLAAALSPAIFAVLSRSWADDEEENE